MKNRPIEEIQKEIEETVSNRNYLIECSQLHCSEGYWKYGNPSVICQINKATRHIANLKLELNRAKQREWGK